MEPCACKPKGSEEVLHVDAYQCTNRSHSSDLHQIEKVDSSSITTVRRVGQSTNILARLYRPVVWTPASLADGLTSHSFPYRHQTQRALRLIVLMCKMSRSRACALIRTSKRQLHALNMNILLFFFQTPTSVAALFFCIACPFSLTHFLYFHDLDNALIPISNDHDFYCY
jgi:hypothetical protein